jgi:hypothetical protein
VSDQTVEPPIGQNAAQENGETDGAGPFRACFAATERGFYYGLRDHVV